MTDINNSIPKSQLLQYLPEFYREQGPGKDFLERFLSIFETVIDNIDKTISDIPGYFDPLTAPAGFIPWLAQWLSLDLYELLGDRNREFILRAFEFYKQKGTVSGIESLVTLLTGMKCRVKEFTNNVLRSGGVEYGYGPGVLKGNTGISRTVDTANAVLLSNMHTYNDEVSYVADYLEGGLYNRNVVGLYIFLLEGEKDFVIKEDQLHKIIDSFLPVFVRAEIFLIEENYETYEIHDIVDASNDRVHGVSKEEFKRITGVYGDAVNWALFYSNNGFSNDLLSRTAHEEFLKREKCL